MIAFKQHRAHELKLNDQGDVTVAFAQLDVIDHDDDVTLPGAFPTKDVPMSAYGHTSWEGELPVGRGSIRETGDWAVFDGKFLMETDQGRNAYHTVKALGELQEWSHGYIPLKASFGVKDGRSVRFLEQLDVFEVSPVLAGAGLSTHTMDIKGLVDASTTSNSANFPIPTLKWTSPPAGEPFASQYDRLLVDVEAMRDRAKGLVDTRTKEGRTLSTANVTRLAALADALTAAANDLRELLDSAAPPKQRADAVDVLISRLRFAGVTIS